MTLEEELASTIRRTTEALGGIYEMQDQTTKNQLALLQQIQELAEVVRGLQVRVEALEDR